MWHVWYKCNCEKISIKVEKHILDKAVSLFSYCNASCGVLTKPRNVTEIMVQSPVSFLGVPKAGIY